MAARFSVDVEGLERTKQAIRKIARRIESGTPRTLQEVGEIGWVFASNQAPRFTGDLAKQIINFQENLETWVILSSPAPSDQGFPVNVRFDEGDFSGMTMWGPGKTRVPFKPRAVETIGFMKKTVAFLRKEFPAEFNLMIERSLK